MAMIVFIVIALCFSAVAAQFKAGGIAPVDINDAGVQSALKFAVDELNGESNSLYLSKVSRVVEAKRQTVAGLMYHLKFEYQTTFCHKDVSVTSIDDCEINPNGQVQSCEVKVWVQPWLDSTVLQEYNCSDVIKDDQSVQLQQFEDFRMKYNKKYESEEEYQLRYKIFQDNLIKAAQLQETDQATGQYGVTKFSDLTEEEFKKFYLTPVWRGSDPNMKIAEIPTGTAPDAFDWRDKDKNAVTQVKDQGSCGSCWAFSTTGNIEGQWKIKKGTLVSLSEQELVDCDKIDEGCNGGLPSNAYKEIMRLGGIMGEEDYPYVGRDQDCKVNASLNKVYINGSMNISKDEGDMVNWLAANGPISIGINANAMQFYFGGISHPWKIFCNPDNLDHGVLIVGYGTKDGTPFWIVKNSWGRSWGVEGYYLVYRGGSVCGLNQMCTSAIVK